MLLLPVPRVTPAWYPMPMFLVPRLFLRALAPMAVLLAPPVLLLSAWKPVAVLRLPVVFKKSERKPAAVFSLPVVFSWSALAPQAVLSLPVVVLKSASSPKAVLKKPPESPETRFRSASVPPAVLAFASLAVGLHPGDAQVGWLQLGVLYSMRTSPATTATRRMIEFI